MRTTILHIVENGKILRSEKTIKILGITVYKKIHHYPDTENWSVVNI